MITDFFSLFNVDNVLLRFDGREVSILETLAMLCGLTCVFLAMRAKVLNFWIGYVYNIFLFEIGRAHV
jgi:nicotinamide riboside transporter PnuC